MSFTPSSKQVDFDPFAQGDLTISVPTSEAQKEIWLSAQMSDGANCAFNESLSLYFNGRLNTTALQTAVNQLVARHSALRATISTDGQHLLIAEETAVPVEVVDLSTLDSTAREQAIQEETEKSVTSPFDLLNGPLLRLTVLQTAAEAFTVLFTVHHIVGDGWSIAVMLDDLGKFYTAAIYGVAAQLPEAGQFVDYAKNEPNSPEAEAYWLKQFDPLPTGIDLPADHSRPPLRTFDAQRIDWEFDGELVKAIKKIGAQHGCTFFTTMLAIFDLFVARLSGESDIVVGTPAAGQSIVGEDYLVGHCVNMLPIRVNVPLQASFSEYLKQIRTTVLDAYEHQAYTFGSLLKKLPIKRDKSRIPLVPIIFNIDQESHELQFGSLKGSYFSNHRRFENFELFVNAVDARKRFVLECTFNSNLFTNETMTAWMAAFEQLCRSIVADPTVQNDRLGLLSAEAKRHLMVDFNQTAVAYDTTATIPQLFAQAAAQYGSKTAVFNANSQLTYQQLDEQANQLAHLLQSEGVQPDQFVGIALERTPTLMVALLAVHKAGGAYLPLDPSYPNERLAFMLDDTQANILMTHSELVDSLPAFNGRILLIDQLSETIQSQPIEAPPSRLTSQNLAYVIHTSGSTGQPKGVLIKQQNVVNFLLTMAKEPGITLDDTLLAVTTLSFDIAVLELFLPLISGASIYIAAKEETVDGERLAQIISDHSISMMQATPVTWQLLLASGWLPTPALKMLSGGEALSRHLADQLIKNDDELWNMYGPTETTIWSSVARIGSEGNITIGHPIANTQFLVLDSYQELTPIGVPGELYIGGDGVAAGYLNRPELTAERFVTLAMPTPTRFYRTGDLVRRRADGQIEWISRLDFQVKVRGFRIELGDIEQAILKDTAVQEAVAIVREDIPNHPQIAAYIVPSGSKTDASEWQEKWEILYESGRTNSEANGSEEKRIISDADILSQLTDSDDWEAEMREFQKQTLDRILSFNPKRVLEIGCGSGQLLVDVAPHVEYMLGTDYSTVAIDNLKSYLDQESVTLPHVDVAVQEGNDFSGIEENQFDTALVLSVAQYFPSPDYLRQVVEGAVRATAPGGVIYLSDIQSYAHLETHHTADQFRRSDDATSLADLQKIINRRIANENELVVDPQFFTALQQFYPEIGRIEFRMRRGMLINETTQFHYDVIIHLAPQKAEVVSPAWHDWQAQQMTVEQIKSHLQSEAPTLYALTNVNNGRIQEELAILHLVKHGASDTLAELKQHLPQQTQLGIDPEDIWKLGEALGYTVHIFWTDNAPNGTMDIVFAKDPAAIVASANQTAAVSRGWRSFANQPAIQSEIESNIPGLRQALKKRLPDYMIPDSITVLESLPLTNNGKVDRKALPAPAKTHISQATQFEAPETEPEKKIAAIWANVLKFERIGKHDNFFEAGGHSLLAIQVIIQIRSQFNIELPIGAIFEYPTVAELAQHVETAVWSTLAKPANGSSAAEEELEEFEI